MSVGIKDVAARAGVSVGTVSNVLNRPDTVKEPTRERVLSVIRELGFVRNEAARALRSGRGRTIGLLVLDVANPFFTDVALGAEAVADLNGAVVSVYNSAKLVDRELRHLDHLEEQRVQGILVTPVDQDNPRLDLLVQRGTPVVLVDRGAGQRNRCSVAVDDVLGGALAGDHLVDQGHRRIALVGGPLTLPQVADRFRGLRERVALRAPEVEPLLVETVNMTVADGRDAGTRLAGMSARRRPTAVFCANDLLALGLLQSLAQCDLRVPQDVAIVGYDDIEYAAAAVVPLSSVRQPRELLGRTAAELLFEEINDREHHQHRQVVFEPELVVRQSSALARRAARGRGPVPAPV